MPRLSLWKSEKSNDYRFFDRAVSEMFTVGATDLLIHKYIGVNNPASSTDLTQPVYDKLDPTNIQDLLFLENRDRKYDPNIYRLRGHYNVQNLDFDLSQFGLFLTNDIIFVTVHYNDMIDVIGRKLMVGDVFELPHLTDYHPLNDTIPIGLRRYYQITDTNYASEGFSQTWYPHLWRLKCEPLVDSQEFTDILKQPLNKDNYLGDWDSTKVYPPGYTITYGDKVYISTQEVPAGINPPNSTYWQLDTNQTLSDIISRYNKNLEINQAAIDEAKRLVPKTGYDRSQLYVVPTFENGSPAPPISVIVPDGAPVFPTGSIDVVSSSLYTTSSPVIRISSENVAVLQQMAASAGMPFSISTFQTTVLQAAKTTPNLTDGGSGPVTGDVVLTLTSLSEQVVGPYGTSDNTYSTADQYVNFTVTSLATPAQTTVVPLLSIPSEMSIGLTIRATIFSENGSPTYIFPTGTRVVAIDTFTNSITVSNPTQGSMPAGTGIEISFDFEGTVDQSMDFRADCDPRFQYIRRQPGPRDFGYLAGYLMGNDEAPNGEPLGSGITFPANPRIGQYFLRLDYLPQKMFRFNGKMWVEISQNVRTESGFTSTDQSQLSTFINESGVTPVVGGTVPTRQSLSKALRIQPD
jgi:hypothetical protein